MDGAHGHDLIAVNIVHVAVGKKNGFEAEALGLLGALDGFLDSSRRSVKTKLNSHKRVSPLDKAPC